MMNTKLILCGGLISALLLTGCVPKQQEQMDYIGSEQAMELALKNSGYAAANVKFIEPDLDKKNGIDYYKVEFTVDDKQYEYDIDALTGTVIASNLDALASAPTDTSSVASSDTSSAAAPNTATSADAVASATRSSNTASSGNMITADTAKTKALAHAGLKTSQVTFVQAKLERDDGRQVYDVEFYTKDYKEYDYEIDAYTGEIISYDYDAEHYNHSSASAPSVSSQPVKQPGTSSQAQSGNMITEETAKAKALAHAGLSADSVTFVKTKLDRDDGKRVYEVEFYTSDYKEYDYDIDAYTGEVLSYDYDSESYTPPATSQTGITADKAKAIALAQVPGATASNIVEFETDHDDGRLSYEGKIIYDSREYEFEIDGYSGAIREWDSEPVGR